MDGLEDFFTHRALHHGVHGGVVREQEGQGEQVQGLDLGRPVDGRAHGHVDHTLANGAELAGLVTLHQRGAGVELDIDAAIRALAHLVGPDFCTLAPWKGRAQHDRQAVLILVLGLCMGRGQAQSQQGGGSGGGRQKATQFHGLSPYEA